MKEHEVAVKDTRDDTPDARVSVPPAPPCPWWCTNPKHTEPGRWESVSRGDVCGWCLSDSVTVPDAFNSVMVGGDPDPFEVHLERYQNVTDGAVELAPVLIDSRTGWHPGEDSLPAARAGEMIVALANVAAIAMLVPSVTRFANCPVWCVQTPDHDDDHAGHDVPVAATGSEDPAGYRGTATVCTVHDPDDSRPTVYFCAEMFKRDAIVEPGFMQDPKRSVSLHLTPAEARTFALNLLNAAALAEMT